MPHRVHHLPSWMTPPSHKKNSWIRTALLDLPQEKNQPSLQSGRGCMSQLGRCSFTPTCLSQQAVWACYSHQEHSERDFSHHTYPPQWITTHWTPDLLNDCTSSFARRGWFQRQSVLCCSSESQPAQPSPTARQEHWEFPQLFLSCLTVLKIGTYWEQTNKPWHSLNSPVAESAVNHAQGRALHTEVTRKMRLQRFYGTSA